MLPRGQAQPPGQGSCEYISEAPAKTFPRLLQNISKAPPKYFLGSSKIFPRLLQKISKAPPKYFRGSSKKFPRLLQKNSKAPSKYFPGPLTGLPLDSSAAVCSAPSRLSLGAGSNPCTLFIVLARSPLALFRSLVTGIVHGASARTPLSALDNGRPVLL